MVMRLFLHFLLITLKHANSGRIVIGNSDLIDTVTRHIARMAASFAAVEGTKSYAIRY